MAKISLALQLQAGFATAYWSVKIKEFNKIVFKVALYRFDDHLVTLLLVPFESKLVNNVSRKESKW